MNVDSIIYIVVIDGLFQAKRVDDVKRFWDEIIWFFKVYDNFVYVFILKGLFRFDRLDEVCNFLYELVDCGIFFNIVNYNILIDSFCKLGLRK